MNKLELINHVANTANISKKSAADAVEAMIKGISGALESGDNVNLRGFGTFTTVQRDSKMARNPRTGETIQIKACQIPKFRPSRELKLHLNPLGLAVSCEGPHGSGGGIKG